MGRIQAEHFRQRQQVIMVAQINRSNDSNIVFIANWVQTSPLGLHSLVRNHESLIALTCT